MLNKTRYLLLACLFLAACVGPQIFQGQLVALNLGMTPETTSQKLGQPPLSVHRVSIDGKEYMFHRYTMNNGININPYLLAFEDGHLKYWGYIDDFRRHPNQSLNRAIDAVLPQVSQ